jgi:hypothetical protein
MICECLLECFGFSMIYGCFWMITTSTGAIWAISKILAATQLGIFFHLKWDETRICACENAWNRFQFFITSNLVYSTVSLGSTLMAAKQGPFAEPHHLQTNPNSIFLSLYGIDIIQLQQFIQEQ